MSDTPDREPRRLFEGGGSDDLLAQAIGAARADRADVKALNRVAARLPLVGVGAAAKAAGATAAAKATSIAPAAVATSSTLSGALIGAALGVVVVGGGFAWQAVRGDPPPAPVAPALVQAPHVAPPEPAPVAPAPPPEASAAPEVVASAAPHASASAAATPASASASADAPSDETEAHLLERARDALASDPSQALSLTDEHARRFTGGALAQEREVVAIQALVRLGRRADARARADRFLAQNPASAHRRRLEALLGD